LLSKLLRFRTLWAYGFDSTAPRAPKNRRLVRKKKLFSFQPTLLFKKVYRGNKEAREAIQRVANRSNYAINGLGLLFFKNNLVCFRQACG